MVIAVKSTVKFIPLLILAAVSVAGGAVNGILGTGGGILIIYILSRYLKGKEYSPKDVFANSMAVILPISLISLFTYDRSYISDGGYMLSVMLPGALGGVLGAVISQRLRPSLLQRIFAILVIYAGIKMIF